MVREIRVREVVPVIDRVKRRNAGAEVKFVVARVYRVQRQESYKRETPNLKEWRAEK